VANLVGKKAINRPGNSQGVLLSTCPSGYVLDGLLCYHPCAAGYTAVGGLCVGGVPDTSKCPWYDLCGLTFAPKCPLCNGIQTAACLVCPSYLRPAVPMICAAGLEQDGLLCYPPCVAGYTGVLSLCWPNCPSTTPIDCGLACSSNALTCAATITDMVALAAASAEDVIECAMTSDYSTLPAALVTDGLAIAKQVQEMGYC